MKHSLYLAALCILCCFLLCSCMSSGNPLSQAEATPLPGQQAPLHSAKATSETSWEATLFYRYLDTSMLASESRVITASMDEANEMAVLRALLEGPSAEKTALRNLFENDMTVLSTSVSDNLLFITLNEAFLQDGIPAAWQDSAQWSAEAPILRSLRVQSIVNTMVENFSYQGVQIMIARGNPAQNTRLDKSYFLSSETGPADPFRRDESVLLSPYNTIMLLFNAWMERDYETLYSFTLTSWNGAQIPVYSDFSSVLDAAPSLASYTASSGNPSENGLFSTHTVELHCLKDGLETARQTPVKLIRENGIWKISYESLQQIMLQAF